MIFVVVVVGGGGKKRLLLLCRARRVNLFMFIVMGWWIYSTGVVG
jgi:hypothetical protein